MLFFVERILDLYEKLILNYSNTFKYIKLVEQIQENPMVRQMKNINENFHKYAFWIKFQRAFFYLFWKEANLTAYFPTYWFKRKVLFIGKYKISEITTHSVKLCLKIIVLNWGEILRKEQASEDHGETSKLILDKKYG